MSLEKEIMRRVVDMPVELQRKVLDYASALDVEAVKHRDERMETAYREMAADNQREADAHRWSEGVIGDIATDQPDAPR